MKPKRAHVSPLRHAHREVYHPMAPEILLARVAVPVAIPHGAPNSRRLGRLAAARQRLRRARFAFRGCLMALSGGRALRLETTR